MRDVFVTMLAYRKFFPNCAWRATLGDDEALIGVYEQPSAAKAPPIYITSRGLRAKMRGEWGPLPYKDMVGSTMGQQKNEATTLTIQMTSGDVDVTIEGGDGRRRDLWAFVRFINRIVRHGDRMRGYAL